MILVLNAGSSSLKYAVFGADGAVEPLVSANIEAIGRADVPTHAAAFAQALTHLQDQNLLQELRAAGHRVVHGGSHFQKPTLIDEAVVAAIEQVVPLAPLHNPANLLGIRLAQQHLLGETGPLPNVAVFDTAFHMTLPPVAYRYAVPQEWFERYGVRKYGFHGISHGYVSAQAREVLAKANCPSRRLITLHLGNGCSAAAVLDGRCIDTSMGLTPLAGLIMGTRPGDVDPGLPGYLHQQGMPRQHYQEQLNRGSGLRGIAGDNDMRSLLQRRAAGDEQARLAVQMFVYRIQATVGAFVAALGGLEALVFTAGIGENSVIIREEVCRGLACFGVSLEQEAQVKVLVVPTREEWAIAEATRAVLCSQQGR